MTIVPACYYLTRGIHGSGPMRAVKVVEPPREGVVLALDVITGKTIRPDETAFIKQTDKYEIAKITKKKVELIL